MEEDARQSKFASIHLGSQAFVTDGQHGYHVVDEKSGIAMLTANCVSHWFADRSEAISIASTVHASNRRSALAVDDLLLSTRGTVGACAIVKSEVLPANLDQDVARILLSPDAPVMPHYVLAYLNCRFGQDWCKRNATGMVQQGLSLAKVRTLPVPVLSQTIQTTIEEVIRAASQCLHDAAALANNAEQSLLQTLGLASWQPPEPQSYVRSSSDVFVTGRLDAQHFHPKYEALKHVLDEGGESVRLGDFLTTNKRGSQPDYADTGAPVINSKHVLRNQVRLDGTNRTAIVGPYSLTIETGDVLINGTGVGTIGRASAYLHDEQAIPDNHVTVLRTKAGLDPVFVSAFLNSVAGQLQVEERLHGSSGQIELYPADIDEFRIWLAPKAFQTQIRTQVLEARSHRRLATHLLDAAKRAVEIAIEDSEAKALAFLEKAMRP